MGGCAVRLTVETALTLGVLSRAQAISGRGGLGNLVEHVNILDAPDTVFWLHGNEFVLTTGFAFRNLTPKDRLDLVISLHGRGCAALGVKKNRYWDNIDEDVVKVCDELDFPLILLPSGCSFEEIIDLLVGEIKLDEYKTLADFHSVLNPLLEVVITSPNAKTLLVALEDLLRNPVVLLDTDWQFMDCSIGQGQTTVQELMSLEKAALDRLDSDYELRLQLRTPFRQTFSQGGRTYSRLLQPVKSLSATYGYLSVWEVGGELRPLDNLILHCAAQLIALVQATLSGAANTNSQSIHAFLTGLLKDQLPAEEVQARARLLNIDFHRGYRVFVLQSRYDSSSQTLDSRPWQIQSNELTGLPVHLRGTANAPAGKLLSASFDDSLVLLAVGVPALSGSVEDLVEPLLVDSLRRLGVDSSKIVAGISQFSDNASSVAMGYEEALYALCLGRSLFPDRSVYYFSRPGNWFSVKDLRQIRGLGLESLITYDATRGTDLTSTLERLVNCGKRQDAAAQLYVHRNTLRYRLGRIEELLRVDLGSPQTQYWLRLAFDALKLLTASAPVQSPGGATLPLTKGVARLPWRSRVSG